MPRYAVAVLSALLALAAAAGLVAQSGSYRGSSPVAKLPAERGVFTFCRLVYVQVRSEALGQGYVTDYPMADRNLMVRLSELTKTEVAWTDRAQPAHVLVRATDPEVFQCPFLFASDVGTAGFNEAERFALREYLLKGGFLWVDDFWGPTALRNWLSEITHVLPESEPFVILPDHPILSSFYFIDEVPQIPSIQFWRSSGGGTSERGSQSTPARFYGMTDANDRLVVFMSHNTDIADGWEREGEDFEFFHLFSPRGYAVGVNVAVWAMTH